ncbi:hypothetical protein ACT8ZV_18395 [Nocardioides sp. MAHUQ-72]|uniref:hypothetical protein n=1 Tax=unclassified Nocardioides TaxID=2615069 RepID=UPI003611FFF0
MTRDVSGALLWGRALLLAAVVLVTGVVGHTSADGLLPGPAGLTVLAALVLVTCAALLGRPATRLRLVAVTVGGQTLVHLALTVTAGHAGDHTTAVVRRAPSPLPVVDGRRVGSLLDQYDAAAGPALGPGPALPLGHLVADLSDHAPMMAAHLVASALVGLWLAVGEQALWTLVALAGALACAPLRVLVAVVPAPAARRQNPVVAAWPGPTAPTPLLARAVVRRGPPSALAA